MINIVLLLKLLEGKHNIFKSREIHYRWVLCPLITKEENLSIVENFISKIFYLHLNKLKPKILFND